MKRLSVRLSIVAAILVLGIYAIVQSQVTDGDEAEKSEKSKQSDTAKSKPADDLPKPSTKNPDEKTLPTQVPGPKLTIRGQDSPATDTETTSPPSPPAEGDIPRPGTRIPRAARGAETCDAQTAWDRPRSSTFETA